MKDDNSQYTNTQNTNTQTTVEQNTTQKDSDNTTSTTTKDSKTVNNTTGYSKIYVSTSGNDNNSGASSTTAKATIKSALTAVNDKGTIYLAEGNYNQHKILINKNVTIIGNNTKKTIINGRGSHVFTIASGTTVTFKAFTITSAKDENGGAIYNKGTLNLESMKITMSTATANGGGVYNKGRLTAAKTSFSNNNADYGGAIYNLGSLSFSRCSFDKNNASKLGSVITSSNDVTLYDTNVTYNGNTAIYLSSENKTSTIKTGIFLKNTGINGGAIYNVGKLNLNKTYFNSNSVTKDGGAIYNTGTIAGYNNTFVSNNADSKGGAIYNKGTLYLSQNSFKTNKANITGGAINNNGTLTVKYSQFTNNNVNTYGGAIFTTALSPMNITISHSTFTNNTAKLGGAVYADEDNKVLINYSIFTLNNNNAVYLKTTRTNYVYNSTFNKNYASTGGAIYVNGAGAVINKVFFKANNATINGGALYNYKGKTTIQNSVLFDNNKIDVYNNKGKLTANYNWWGNNSKPSSSRQYSTTINNWIYLKVTTSGSNYVNSTLKIMTTLNYIYNGNKTSAYNTSSKLPRLTINEAIVGGGIRNTYTTTTGTITISKKITSTGNITITTYSYNQKLKKTINVLTNTKIITNKKMTALYVKLDSSVTKANVTQWVNAKITDVYVQSRASTNNTALLKKVISLCKNTNINVHTYMVCFSTSNGFNVSTAQQNMIKNFVKQVIRINGLSGVCLDYARYSGSNPSIVQPSVITNFVKSVNSIVKGYNKNLVVSMTVYAEKSDTKKYYGQDYANLSKYVDVMMPMAYKYSYHAGTNWLKDSTAYVVKYATHSKVVTILQTYDNSYNKLSTSELNSDAKAVMSGGSQGYALFRYGYITKYPTAAANLS